MIKLYLLVKEICRDKLCNLFYYTLCPYPDQTKISMWWYGVSKRISSWFYDRNERWQ